MTTNQQLASATDLVIESIRGTKFAESVQLFVKDKYEEDFINGRMNDQQSWYAVNRLNNDETEVMIYDAIGSFGITAGAFVNEIKGIKSSTLRVKLNTPGGEVFDATAIYNALKSHPSRVVVDIDGVAASAGSFIALAGDHVRIADNAYMMIHEARGGVLGPAEDMERYAGELRDIDDNIAAMYEKKTGKPRKHWRDLMSVETWFTASEAKEAGLVDEVYEATKKVKARATSFKVYNQAKIPDSIRELWGITKTKTAPDSIASCDAVAPVSLTQESLTMANENNVSPAPTPAATVSPPDANDAHRRKIDELKAMTAEGIFEQGRHQGISEGIENERARVLAIFAVCPGREDIARDGIANKHTPDLVKLTFEKVSAERAIAMKAVEEKEEELVRWKALAANGGLPGGVALGLASVDEQSQRPPKAQAEWEWDNNPKARQTARSKEIYILARTAELEGTHRSFTREPVSV